MKGVLLSAFALLTLTCGCAGSNPSSVGPLDAPPVDAPPAIARDADPVPAVDSLPPLYEQAPPVTALLAADEYELTVALTFDYGQRARRRELGASYSIAGGLGVHHRTVFLPFFQALGGGALLEPAAAIPTLSTADLEDAATTEASAAAVWIPNRNGIFISIGAAWAERLEADVLVVGFNSEEARTFPDNSMEFVERQNEALAYSTANGVRVVAPTGGMTKTEIVALARDRDWPLELMWSCYDGGDEPCGRCESCTRFEAAVTAAGAEEWLAQRRESRR